MKKEFSVIGKSVVKKDAVEKALGHSQFAADLKMPGTVHAGVFRSSIVHGYIKKLDIAKAQAIPGVLAVLTHKDVPGRNRIGIVFKDEPVLVDEKIRRFGDAIAIVAAETEDLVKEALEAIEVEYEEIPGVFSVEEAAKEDAPKIHGESNIHLQRHLEHGNVDEAFKECDIIIENDYESHLLSHMFIEPEAGLAYYDNDILTMICSTQNPHYDRSEVAAVLGMPYNRVHSVQATTGGGFGGKLDIGVQCHIALLAYHTGRPVRMVRSRRESTLLSSKRHPMKMHYKTGATKDGKILATEVTILGDTGAYASYGAAVITRASVHAAGPYEIPNIRVDATFYFTNNPMAGAFRGFGVPQVAAAHEGQMNALAKALNMDPIDLRILNAHRPGSVSSTGQVLDKDVEFIKCLEEVRKKADEVLPPCIPTAPNKRRGRGYGCMYYGIGNTGLPNPAAAFVEVLADASVNLMVGCADIGQGSTTVLAQICAETLGVRYEDVKVTFANTQVTPEGGATSASRQTFISGMATKNAADMAKQTLIEVACEVFGTQKDDLVFANGEVYPKSDETKKMLFSDFMKELVKRGKLALGAGSYNPKTTSLNPKDLSGIPFEVYSYAATIMDLEVNIETGTIDLLNVVSAHDVGTAVNRAAVEGQIEGGVAMGVGYVVMENMETRKGVITNPEFSKYLILTAADMPNIYPVIVEGEGEAGPYGAKGVGEPALIPMIPATIDAVENALGLRFEKTPILPIDIMRKLYSEQSLER